MDTAKSHADPELYAEELHAYKLDMHADNQGRTLIRSWMPTSWHADKLCVNELLYAYIYLRI
ncbi:hypothetical protein PF003_g32231 [Phytophthora fragariae]|nr:hypothetical protein PF003_g32231 [Phytophthora fragariae]